MQVQVHKSLQWLWSLRRASLWWTIIAVATVTFGVAAAWQVGRRDDRRTASYDSEWLKTQPVAALGRIEPEDGVIAVGVRSLTGQPSLVADLHVREGDYVRSGEVLATLNSKDQLEAVWRKAQAQVVLARRRLEQVEAGAKPGDLAAQQAEIARARVELAIAETEHRRNRALYDEKILSASTFDTSRLRVETDREALRQATERLRALAEVRDTDLRVARADLQVAEEDARQAKAEYEQSIIRSPASGRVIKIHSWPGEEVNSDGLLELAKTAHMYVIAEVMESDLPRISLRQKVTVTGDCLSKPLEGFVEQIGMEVGRSQIINTDPAAFSDTRIVDVKVRLLDPKRAENLINAEVRAKFRQ